MLESLIRKVHKQRPFVSFKKAYSFSWQESFKLSCIVMNLFYGNYLRQKESHAGSQKGTPRGIPNQRSVSTQPFKPSNAKPLLNCCSNDCSLGNTSGTSSFFASGSRFPSCDWMVVNTLTSTFTSHSIDWRSSLSTLLPMIN